jgi:uracil-DNA glycosylase
MTISNVSINVDFNKKFGRWMNVLKEDIFEKEFSSLLFDIEEEYNNYIVYPNKDDIFKAFQLCDPDNLKVVIVGDEPFCNGRSNGLAYGSKNDFDKMHPETELILNCVEKQFYEGFNLTKDPTLNEWAQQGVLLLNKSLTVRDNYPKSHEQLWDDMMINIIQSIDYYYQGIIFLFLGVHAKKLRKHISEEYNLALEYIAPKTSIEMNLKWDCPHFKHINKLLTKNKKVEIIW